MIFVKPVNKFKIFKYDAAPFFFYLEVFPPDLIGFESERDVALLKKIVNNPIMPLPMRVDRVFNGEQSLLIRPKKPISFPITEELNTIINPAIFLQYGFEKLLNFTEIRAFDEFALSLTAKKTQKWWDSTKFLYTKLTTLEKDFIAFIKSYIDNLLKAKLNNEDLITPAINYCKNVKEICEKRIEENSILIETTHLQTKGKLYTKRMAKYRKKMKKIEEVEIHPELINLDIFDISEIGFEENLEKFYSFLDSKKPKLLKYIPLMFYDDLLECMLLNLQKLEEGEDNILDPSFLIDYNIIILQESKDLANYKTQDYSWYNSFEELDFESIIQSMKTTLQEFIKKKAESIKKDLKPSYSPPPSSSK